jgi:4-carboxymuconolactone decarboxylase
MRSGVPRPDSGRTQDARIPLPEPEDMTAAQLAVFDEVVLGQRGRMVGPLRAAMHSPELARQWARMGEFLRYRTTIPPRQSELAILVTARRWTSQVEWAIHAQDAVRAGLPTAVIEAVRLAEAPQFDCDDDRLVYEFTRALQHTGTVDLVTYNAIRDLWGDIGVVELTALIGYYVLVAMTLNVHEVPMPNGYTASLPDLVSGELIDLPLPGLAPAGA